jgi:predicted aspartyl protease
MGQQGRIEEALNLSLELRELLLDRGKQSITDHRIVALAASFKAEMEKIDHYTEIVILYQMLYNLYPGNQSIVFEPGIAYFAVQQHGDAWGMLNQPIYEPAPSAAPQGNPVELTKSGEHCLIDSSVNATKATLLLDTGAWLTALDQKFLERISVRDTGGRLSLQTVNGLTESIAYEIRLPRVGQTQVNNFEVAGLDFDERSRFERLLGMEFLNMFSYTIYKSNNTLMLTPN